MKRELLGALKALLKNYLVALGIEGASTYEKSVRRAQAAIRKASK
jgi:hypothetical protein